MLTWVAEPSVCLCARRWIKEPSSRHPALTILARVLIPVSELLFLGLGQGRGQTSIEHVCVCARFRGRRRESCGQSRNVPSQGNEERSLSTLHGTGNSNSCSGVGRMVLMWCFGDAGDEGGQAYPWAGCRECGMALTGV